MEQRASHPDDDAIAELADARNAHIRALAEEDKAFCEVTKCQAHTDLKASALPADPTNISLYKTYIICRVKGMSR